MLFIVLLFCIFTHVTCYNTSISGISSGGYMAVQFHVAHSSKIIGIGVIGGGPYYCANNNALIALNSCMKYPHLINIDELIFATDYASSILHIDDTNSLSRAKIYLYSGVFDETVKKGVVEKLEKYYRHYNSDARNIMTEYNIRSGHSFPTENYGIVCNETMTPFISKCNYNGAYNILKHIYDTNIQTQPYKLENIKIFSQTKYTPNLIDPKIIGMDHNGYIYVPSKCRHNYSSCRTHIALHGCLQNTYFINHTFIYNAGYNEVAEGSNIIIIYPQTYPSLSNPKGCWDWWGFTGPEYATKFAPQIQTINNINDHIGEIINMDLQK